MKLFCKNSQREKVANYLRKISPPQVFDCALNTAPKREIVKKIKAEN